MNKNINDYYLMFTKPKEWEKSQQTKQSLEYQRRQTISSEKALEEAKKANRISERSVKKSNAALIVSIVFGILSTILGVISLVVSIKQ